MQRRMLVLIIAVVAILAALPGCKQSKSGQSGNVALTPEAPDAAVAGITWSYPTRWTKGGPRPMRTVTYMIAPAEGDAEGAECAVYFFGGGAGGDVDMNIQRWAGQFEGASDPVRKDDKVNGMAVSKVQIAGTYLAPAGPMMESQAKKEHFRLLGAIVEAPGGKVFFKLTGPAKTVDAASNEFDALLASIDKK